jgi:hypothetical protein
LTICIRSEILSRSTISRAVWPALALAVLSLHQGQALGGFVSSESFSYNPATSLSGNNGGTGFTGTWSATANALVVDPGTPLSVSNAFVSVNGGDHALQVSGTGANNDNLASRQLAQTVSDLRVAVTFLFRYTGTGISDNNFLTVWLDNSATGNHASVPNVGLKGNRGNGTGTEDFFARNLLNQEVFRVDVTPNHDYFVRAVFEKVGASATYNRVALSVYDHTGLLGSGTMLGNSTISQFNTVGLRGATLDANDTIILDELSVSVVPVPGTLLLSGIGLATVGLGGAWRRFRAA